MCVNCSSCTSWWRCEITSRVHCPVKESALTIIYTCTHVSGEVHEIVHDKLHITSVNIISFRFCQASHCVTCYVKWYIGTQCYSINLVKSSLWPNVEAFSSIKAVFLINDEERRVKTIMFSFLCLCSEMPRRFRWSIGKNWPSISAPTIDSSPLPVADLRQRYNCGTVWFVLRCAT